MHSPALCVNFIFLKCCGDIRNVCFFRYTDFLGLIRWCGSWWRRQKTHMSAGFRASFVRYPARPLQIPRRMSVGPRATLSNRATPSRTPTEHRPIIGRESADCRSNYSLGFSKFGEKSADRLPAISRPLSRQRTGPVHVWLLPDLSADFYPTCKRRPFSRDRAPRPWFLSDLWLRPKQ